MSVEAPVRFFADGLEQDHCLLAVTTGPKTSILRDALGDRAGQVEFTDWAAWYPSPKEALSRYTAFVKEKFEAGAVWIRIVAEAGWSGQSAGEIAAWTRYESLVNLVFASAPATIMCTYNLLSFPSDVITEACCTHPELVDGTGTTASRTYRDPEDFLLEPQAASH